MQFFNVAVVELVLFVLSVQSKDDEGAKKYCGRDRTDVFYFKGSCYLFAHDDLSSGESRSIFATGDYSCYTLLSGSHLLAIGSEAEHAFIEGILAEKKSWCVAEPCWLGLRFEIPSKELDSRDGWKWSDETSVSSFIPTKHYHLPNPKNGAEEQFISFIPKACGHSSLTRFNNREAISSFQFICERKVGNNKENCTHVNGDSCYVYIKEELNYSKAQEKCLNLSASLISIETDNEKDFIIGSVTKECNVEIWTSLKFNSAKGLWIWKTGKELSIKFETYQLSKTNDAENHSRCASLQWNNEGNYSFVTNVYSEKCYRKLNYWCKGQSDPNDQCLKTKCLNGATCIDGYWTHTCQCTEEWSGDLCQYKSTCEDDYIKNRLIPNLCVKIYDGKMKYSNASSLCNEKNNGQILGKEYINFRGIHNTITKKPIWYGLIWKGGDSGPNDKEVGDNWKWILDNSTSYISSQTQYFQATTLVDGNLTGPPCFYMHLTADTIYFKQAPSCTETRKYICEYYKGSGQCTPKYDEDTCYKEHTDTKSKSDAEKACEGENGFLVDFERDIETTILLSKNEKRNRVEGAWVGLTVKDSMYVWSKHSDHMPNGLLGTGLCDPKFTVEKGQHKTCVIDSGIMYMGQCIDLKNVECDQEHGFICVYEADKNDCLDSPPKCKKGICEDKFHDYECNCKESDFEGEFCDVPINDCKNKSCQHNSTCVDQTRNAICQCLHDKEFTGDNCEIGPCERNPNLCKHNGRCKFVPEAPFYECLCLDKYTGQHCTELKEEEEQDVFEILIPIFVVVISFLVSGGLIHFIIQYQKRQKLKHKTRGSEELESEYVKETLWERVRVVKEDRSKVEIDSLVKEERSTLGIESVVKVDKSKLGESESVVKVDKSKLGDSEFVVNIEGSKVGQSESVVKVDKSKLGESEFVVNIQGSKVGQSESVVKVDKSILGESESLVKEEGSKVGGSESFVKVEGSKVGESESFVKVEGSKVGESESVVKEEGSKVGESESLVKEEGSKSQEREKEVKVDIEQMSTQLELGKEPRVGSSFIKTDVNDYDKNSIKTLRDDDDSKDAAKEKDREKRQW